MTITLPRVPVTMPSTLACAANGQIGNDVLVSIGIAGRLERTAARAWTALWLIAHSEGIDLTWTYGGTYRSLAAQEQLFYQRWQTTPRKGADHAFYNGVDWWLKAGVARAGVPGTSNHGWGLAIDTALGPDPAHAVGITPQLDWLVANAPAVGFSWESQSEPWHIRYVTGDDVPQRVLDVEAMVAAS